MCKRSVRIYASAFTRKVEDERSGNEEIRTKIQPSKPKRNITKITNSQNTKRTYGQPSELLKIKVYCTRRKIVLVNHWFSKVLVITRCFEKVNVSDGIRHERDLPSCPCSYLGHPSSYQPSSPLLNLTTLSRHTMHRCKS